MRKQLIKMKFWAVVAVMAVASAAVSSADNAGQTRTATLSVREQVAEGVVSNIVGEILADDAGDHRMLSVTPANQSLSTIISLNDAWASRLQQAGETNLAFDESTLSTTVTFQQPTVALPPPFTPDVFELQIMNNLLVVWACDAESVTLFVVGDMVRFTAEPGVEYLEARSAGRFRFDSPIDLKVVQGRSHYQFSAIQETGAAVQQMVSKSMEYPAGARDITCVIGAGDMPPAGVSSNRASQFEGTVTDGSVSVPAAVADADLLQINQVERVSREVIRVYASK